MRSTETNRPLERTVLLAVACFAIWLTGCAEGSTVSSGPATSSAEVSAIVSVCNRTPNGCVEGTSFSLAALRDFSVRAQWSNVPQGTHTALIEFLAPGGAAYQTRHAAFAVGETDGGSAATDTIVPVSGSMIAQRGVTGMWTVRVSLDGQWFTTQAVDIQP